MTKLYSPKLEISVLYSIFEADEWISDYLISNVVETDFAWEPALSIFRKIKFPKTSISWKDFVDHKLEVAETYCEARDMLQQLHKYSKIRYYFKIQKDIVDILKMDNVDVTALDKIIEESFKHRYGISNLI